jgi:hypothetical protein
MSRRLLVAASLVVVVGSPWLAPEARAQDIAESDARPVTPALSSSLLQPLRLIDAGQLPVTLQLPRPATLRVDTTARPGSRAVLTSLYASTAAMQMLDVHSTFKALDRGAVEVNPLMSGLVKHRAAFVTTKAAVAAATIYAANKVARHNKVAAIATLVAINSAYAMIVSNNYRIAGR